MMNTEAPKVLHGASSVNQLPFWVVAQFESSPLRHPSRGVVQPREGSPKAQFSGRSLSPPEKRPLGMTPRLKVQTELPLLFAGRMFSVPLLPIAPAPEPG